MGRTMRRMILVGLGLVMLMGIGVYFRLWIIDYHISANDTQLLRKEFDLASTEAMDEAAHWRRRYDYEFYRASECLMELQERKTTGVSTVLDKKIEMLQKQNIDLLETVESLKKDLEAEKLKCSGLGE